MLALLSERSLLFSQINFDTSYSANQLVDKVLMGQGVRAGNIKYSGNRLAIAAFQTDSAVLGIRRGIILSTGSIFNANGPNTSPFITTKFTNSNIKKGQNSDRDLNRISKSITYDIASLEFDFIPFNNRISFIYVFGSEEYSEYVGSRFNDVFAFIINGEKLHNQNLAVIPKTILPVTINTINEKQNSRYFIDNDYFKKVVLNKVVPGQKTTSEEDEKFNNQYEINKRKRKKLNRSRLNTLQYDGLTTVMLASCYVIPYKKYHMKIAIGDVGDSQYDSGVFLEGGSFSSDKDRLQPRFKEYLNLSNTLNFDSIFGLKNSLTKAQKDSAAKEEAEYELYTLTDVNFDFDSYVIPDSSKKELDALAEYLKNHRNYHCDLYGYTDNLGTRNYNQPLSEKRALEVREYLISKNIEPLRLDISGHNYENPVADNNDERGRAKNRRVEIVLIEE
ncbi:MAG: OmpA family protein [Chitinophagales bacterium]|nr:OmpA family protein [Chitinophagales bacterium]